MTEFLVCALHGRYPVHAGIRTCCTCDVLRIPIGERMLNIKIAECTNPECGAMYDTSSPVYTHCLTPNIAQEKPQKGQSTQNSPKPKRSKQAKAKEAPVMPVFAGIPSFSAIVGGQPLPKGRPRFSGKRAYTPKKTEDYENLLKASIAPMIDTPFTGLLCVELEFCRATHVLADVDNLSKAVLDAMNTILWNDDKQIRRLIADVSYGHEKPCIKIKVYEGWR